MENNNLGKKIKKERNPWDQERSKRKSGAYRQIEEAEFNVEKGRGNLLSFWLLTPGS